MNQKETLKIVFKNFIKNNGIKTFYTIIFWWLIMALFDIINPFFYKEVISIIETFVKTNYFDDSLAIKVFIFWAIFIVIGTLFRAIIEYLTATSNIKNYKLNHLFYSNKIFNLNYNEYLNQKTWTLFKIYDRWQEDSLELIYVILSEIIVSVFSILVLSVILFFINIKMAFATLALVPVMIFIWIFFNKKTRKLQDDINNLWDKAFWIIWDVSSNLSLVKTLVLEWVFKKKFKNKIEIADKKQRTVAYRWIIGDIYIHLIFLVSRFLVLWVWIYEIKNWNLDIATLFLFFTFVWSIYFPLGFIFNRLKNLQKRLKWIQKFYEKFENIKIEQSQTKKIELKNISWEIKFNKVNFWYSRDKKILKNLSFKINPWEKIAFVGNTWAGKSTIVNLLFRFWDIDSGEIFIDWNNINKLSKESLRSNIGLVMQDNSLFNTTIKENLLFANPKASDIQIKKALKDAQADFVFKLKKWVNTEIWERWLKLSWWEKQRLSIARLFLKNPKILILDEATSALDNKTEKLVQKALDKLVKWRTSIVIAHRLSTIQNADKIFMLENWKIVEEWDYKKLMKKKNKFFSLANPENLILN